jgi:hypothetical protein
MRVDTAFRDMLRARYIDFTVLSKDVQDLTERVKYVEELIEVALKSSNDEVFGGGTRAEAATRSDLLAKTSNCPENCWRLGTMPLDSVIPILNIL